jgi:hypothetical protein
MAKLPLPQSDRARVFRKVVALLQADPILKRTIRPASWYVWDGRPDQKAGVFAVGELPALRITPRALPAAPETVTRQSSPMGLAVELATDGTDIDDAMNLWAAVEAVFFPGDGSLKVLAALQAITPSVISVRLSSPAFTPHPAGLPDDMILTEGHLTVELLVKR